MSQSNQKLQKRYERAVGKAAKWRKRAAELKRILDQFEPERPKLPSSAGNDSAAEKPVRLIHPIYANPPFGIFSRVARQLGVSPSFVRKVALGLHTSKRVADVLISEAKRIANAANGEAVL